MHRTGRPHNNRAPPKHFLLPDQARSLYPFNFHLRHSHYSEVCLSSFRDNDINFNLKEYKILKHTNVQSREVR